MILHCVDNSVTKSRISFLERLKTGIPAGFLGNLSWQYVSTIWTMLMGFCYSLLLGRSLGVAEFGLYSLSLGFATVVFQLFELRLHEAVIRYVAEYWENKDLPRMTATINLSLWLNICSGLLALTVILGLMPLAKRFLIHDERSLQLLILAGLTVFCSNVSTATAFGILRTFGKFRAQTLVTVTGTTLKLIATYAVITWLGSGILGVMVVGVITSLCINAVLVWLALRVVKLHVPHNQNASWRLLQPRIIEMRRFVVSTYLFSLSGIPTKELDVTLLGLFSSAQVVGVYKMAKNFITAMWAASDPVFYVVYPELARLWSRKDFAMIRSFLKRLTLVLGAAGILIYLGAMLVVPKVILITLGPAYAESIIIFRWMAWFIIFWMPFLWINSLFLAAGKPDLMLKASIAASLSTIGLYFIFIPIWHGSGAALAYALGTPLGLVFAFWVANRAGILHKAQEEAL